MLYSHYKMFTLSVEGVDLRRQILTFLDVRFWRLKSIPAPSGLTPLAFCYIVKYNLYSGSKEDAVYRYNARKWNEMNGILGHLCEHVG